MSQELSQLSETPPLPGATAIPNINAIARTIATNFAGATDPAGMAWAFSTWADTGNNLLKRRNAAGTAWVTICPLFEELATKAGSIAAATYAEVAALTSDEGPIVVTDRGGFIWQWADTAYFTGYRSPLCGKLDFGWTPTPLAWQVEGIGGTLNEVDHGGLIARFRESGLTVALGSWVAGEYKIADMGGGEWKAPDMRNQFLRFTGTDADTANARVLGSWQSDAIQNITGSLGTVGQIGAGGDETSGAFSRSGSLNDGVQGSISPSVPRTLGFDASRVARTAAETRSLNTAFIPVINL